MTIEFKNWKNENMNTTNIVIDGKLVEIGSSEQKVIAKLNATRDALLKLSSFMPTFMEMDSLIIFVEETGGSKQKLNILCTKKY